MRTIPPFDSEELKHTFPLTAESVILDIGAYQGNWAREMSRRYGCEVIAFEPCEKHYLVALKALHGCAGVSFLHGAVGHKNGFVDIHECNDSSGEFADGPVENVPMMGIMEVRRNFLPAGVSAFDLAKINAEGAEYSILETLCAHPDELRRFKRILVQFHSCVPAHEARYARIYQELTKTHEHVFGTNPLIWQLFTLKS